MNWKKSLGVFILILSCCFVSAQTEQNASNQVDKSEEVSLDQALSESLTKGPNVPVLGANLDTYRYALETIKSTNALSTTSSLDYSVSRTQGDSTVSSKTSPLVSESSTSGEDYTIPNIPPQNVGASLALTIPGTVLSGTYSKTFTNASNYSYDFNLLSLSLSQTLWDGYAGGQSKASYDTAVNNYSNAMLENKASRLTLVLEVKQAYYTLLLAQQNLITLKKTVDQDSKLYDTALMKFNANQSSAVDLESARVNLESAKIDYETGQNTIVSDRLQLATLMGRSSTDLFTVKEIADPVLPANTLEEALKIARAQRVEGKEYDITIQNAEIQKRLLDAKSGLGVALTASTVYGNNGLSNTSALTATAGAKLTLPVFDSGATTNQKKSQDTAITLALSEKKQWEITLTADVVTYWNQAVTYQKKAKWADENVKAYEKQLEVAQLKYENGTESMTDLLTASLNLATAQLTAVEAKNNAQLGVFSLMSQLGIEEKQ